MSRAKVRRPERSAAGRKKPAAESADAAKGVPTARRAGGWLSVGIVIGLVAVTLAAYRAVFGNGFIDYDDPIYINHNSHVLNGLTGEDVRWAFVSGYAENWHPLTWLSHMLDVQLFGLQPGYHHLTNLALHIGSTLLLFAALHAMTGALRRSAFVAALFAIHPLHVESVAWIAERKDVLSTFFFMLALAAYAAYTRNRSWWRYAAVVATAACGLMAKPMLVTLPFVLLLLDYWPLGRIGGPSSGATPASPVGATSSRETRLPLRTLVMEKVPLLVLAAAMSIITFIVQSKGGAVGGVDRYPLLHRFANVPLAYVSYLGKTVLPMRLGVFYPYPKTFVLLQVLVAGVLLMAVSITAVRLARRRPYLPVGWFWFLGMLVPVIGLVQVGGQAMADRYTYVPLVGLFIIVAWGASDLAAHFRLVATATSIAAGATILVLAAMTRIQVSYWKDSLTLWRHTLAVTNANARAHTNVANSIGGAGDIKGAIGEYEKALAIDSTLQEAHNNLAWYLDKDGRTDEASSHYSVAIRINPNYTSARNNFGVSLANHGRTDDAIRELSKSLAVDSSQADIHYDLAVVLAARGRSDEAIRHLKTALALDSTNAAARRTLASLQASTK